MLVLFAAVALVAAACGDDDDDAGPAADTTVPAADTTIAADTADDGDAASDGDTTTTTVAADSTTTPTAEFVSIEGVPGVTDDEIRFSVLATATANNPTGSCYLECFSDGVEAYFAYRNSIGGVHGRDLVIAEELDDELGRGQELALQIISDEEVFGVFSSPLIPTPFADFAREGIPLYVYLTAPSESVNENLFGSPAPSCVECIRVDQAFIAETVGATNIAALGYSVESSSICAEGVRSSFESYGPEIGGAEVVYINSGLDFGLANGVAPEVSAMIEAGVDLVFTCMDANGVKSVGEEMRRQGLDAVLVQNSSYDAEFFANNADAYEGAVVQTSVIPDWAALEGTERELFDQWIAETGGNGNPEITAHAWVVARLAADGIEAAGAPFDRASVIEATNAIENFTAGGLISPWDVGTQRAVSAETVDDVGPYCRVTMRVVNGVPEPVAPATPEEPFLCWDSESGPYTQPTPMRFE